MNRTLRLLRLPAEGCDFGHLLVMAAFDDPERGVVNCAAAPLLAAALKAERAGTSSGPAIRLGRERLMVSPEAARASGVMFAVSYLDSEGVAGGFALAARRDDQAGMAAALRAAERWMSAVGSRRLLMDDGVPLCWGGQRAVRLTQESAAGDEPAYVLGYHVADRASLDDLSGRRVIFTEDLDTVPEGSRIVFPAHGVSMMARATAVARGLRIVDGTCPLVAAAHDDAARYADRGDLVVVIGRAGDAAMPPLVAHAAGTAVIAATREDVCCLDWPDGDRVSFVIDPGMPAADVMPVMAALRARFPRLRGYHLDMMCSHASDRAHTVASVAAESELTLIVAGDGEDADTESLARIAVRAGGRPWIVRRLADISPELLKGVTTLGLVPTLVAPPGLAARVARALSGLGPLSLSRRNVHTWPDALPRPPHDCDDDPCRPAAPGPAGT
jgi:4-hydroxy-3-methylbut-2-en-1-yl diphosphate reductase